MAVETPKSNHRTVGKVVLVVIAMFGFGYLLVPLYNVMCDITGLNGKTGRIDEAAAAARYMPDQDRTITVQFIVNNNEGMPWDVTPNVPEMKVHPGQIYATLFTAHNGAHHDMTGQAVPSIAPNEAAKYFNKTECFCFTKQDMAAGETREMPLRFIVDPALPKHIKTLSLAYTFFDVTAQANN